LKIETVTGPTSGVVCDALIFFIFDEAIVAANEWQDIDKALNGRLSLTVAERPGCGKFGVTTIHDAGGMIGAKRIVLTGLGKREDYTAEKLRSGAGIAVRAAMQYRTRILAAVLPGGLANMALSAVSRAITEGSILGSYKFLVYKSEPDPATRPELLYLLAGGGADVVAGIQAGIHIGSVVAEAVNLTRDMVNQPANHMTPAHMALQAEEIASRYGLEITVLERDQMSELAMSSFLAVAQGSEQPPKMIIIKYQGCPTDSRLLALVGKGITFDSGGISLKPSEGLQEMKDDMAGGAAVLGAVQAIAALRLPVNILAVVPCTENMPSGAALKPGDVITSMAGKTIEIISSDAEGRLILADAVTYAIQLGASHVVDLATLTGACVVALGHVASAVMSNDAAFKRRILEAAAESGEKMWELPLFDEYKEQIKSDIADIKNTGGRPGGAITAGLFIAEFAAKTPWIHVDIAGTATCDKESGYNTLGGSGTGVRTLVQMAMNWKIQ
jgi:leucyl aminopeptidase